MDAVVDSVAPDEGSAVQRRSSGAARAMAPSTLAGAWLERCSRSPHRTALVFEGVRWTYELLHQAACQVARRLQTEGLSSGQSVVLMMDNGPDLPSSVANFWALCRFRCRQAPACSACAICWKTARPSWCSSNRPFPGVSAACTGRRPNVGASSRSIHSPRRRRRQFRRSTPANAPSSSTRPDRAAIPRA